MDVPPPTLRMYFMGGPFSHMKDNKAYFRCETILLLQATIGNAESKLLR